MLDGSYNIYKVLSGRSNKSKTSEQNTVYIGESIEDKDGVSYTVTGVEDADSVGEGVGKVSIGNNFIMVSVKITNNSNEAYDVNSSCFVLMDGDKEYECCLDVLTALESAMYITPPDVANKMLDMLPQELFRDPNTKFLDPAVKSGVLLREIAKKLIAGLADKIPNLKDRCDWIFHRQLYGIAITELTSLLVRRSVYCSKYPNSPFSISKFDDVRGNIYYRKLKHTWKEDKCIYCGATK